MPYEKVILGPKYAVRLEDLQATDALLAQCRACGRAWRIAPHRLHDRFFPFERLIEIGRQMRCTRCKTGAAIDWHVLRASPPRYRASH